MARNLRTSVFLLALLLGVICNPGQIQAQEGPWVITTDYSVFGGLRGFDLNAPWTVSGDLATVPGDAVGRHHQGLVYVVGRGGANLIQIYDPASGFNLVREFSLGNGLNPQDIAILDDGTAYVSCYDAAVLLRVDLNTGTVLDSFSTEAFADTDGLPETAWLHIHQDKLYITCQLLDRGNYYSPSGPGQLLVFDLNTRTWAAPVQLIGANPYTRIRVVEDAQLGPRLVVGCVGYYAMLDGGIEMVDPDTNQSEGYIITEADLGGDVLNFVYAGTNRLFALRSNTSFATSIVGLTPGSTDLTVIHASSGYNHADLVFDGDFQLFVADRTPGAGGLRIFDVESGAELTSGAIPTGLPPFQVIMPTVSAPSPAGELPTSRLALGQPYPNPCNPTATLDLTGISNSQVKITVFDLKGRCLQAGQIQLDGSGQGQFVFNGRDKNGRNLAAGIYRVAVQSGSSFAARSVVLIK